MTNKSHIKMSENKFYIYHLIDFSMNLPFYIGKGKDKRMYDHVRNVKNGIVPNNNKLLFNKIKELLSNNQKIKYKKL